MSFETVAHFEAALAQLSEPDEATAAAACARQLQLTKPPGSLGRLEKIAVFFASWQAREMPRIDRGRIAIFAGNHGVAVPEQMVANFRAGGAAINALAAAAGLELKVVPLDLKHPTADFTVASAMDEAECLAALSAGAAVVEEGLDLLVLGEMGIGNSTAAAALCALSFGGGARPWVGPGTGLDSQGVDRKAAVVDRAVTFHAAAAVSPFEILRRVGGREIAAIAGAVLRARQLRVPVLLDGFICCSALAPLAAASSAIVDHCLAGHCSAEPGHDRLLRRIGLDPLLRLDMRLGEASGARRTTLTATATPAIGSARVRSHFRSKGLRV